MLYWKCENDFGNVMDTYMDECISASFELKI